METAPQRPEWSGRKSRDRRRGSNPLLRKSPERSGCGWTVQTELAGPDEGPRPLPRCHTALRQGRIRPASHSKGRPGTVWQSAGWIRWNRSVQPHAAHRASGAPRQQGGRPPEICFRTIHRARLPARRTTPARPDDRRIRRSGGGTAQHARCRKLRHRMDRRIRHARSGAPKQDGRPRVCRLPRPMRARRHRPRLRGSGRPD